jgi:hypothetical protein
MENKWEDNAHLFNNPNETIGDHLKDFLSSIPLVDPDTISYSPTTNEITYKGTNSSLTGFVESADFRLMNMKLIELLKGKLNVTEMLDTLREYGMESTSSYGKAILILYSQLNDPANEAMRNAFFSYYHKRLTTRYANLFRNSGEALQHEQIIANKIDGKYVLADEWRNAILTNFDNDHFSLEWSLNWNKQYNEFVKGYKDYNGSILPIEYATQISDLYADLGIEIEPAVLQYYYKKTNDKSEFGRLFLTPMNRLKNVNSDPDNYGFIDKKINDPTLKFSEEGNLIRLGELVAYFTFGKGRFSTMNVKKNVVFTPANPHFISDFMDNINHKDDAHVLNYLSRYTNVAGSEHSYLLWGDQVDSLGKRIRGKEGIGFLNYKIELGQRIPVSINRKNIDGFTYAELDGINELNTNIPKEYTDLSDSEWDLLNLITFYNSEGKRPTRPDTVTIPMVIPSDGGVLGTFNVPKVKVTTEDNAAWFIIKEGYYSTNTNQAKFDSGAYFTEAYAEKFAPINDFINSPLLQANLGAIRSEIEEIKTATKVIFEIDTTTGLPKRDDNGMPIVRKGVKGQLFYHYMKHDADGNPIYFDDKGMPTGRGFKSHLFGFKALDGSIKTLNDSTFVFSNGFISQYTNVNAKDVTARLLALIHNHLHEQYYIANETFKGYKNYVSRIINKNNQPILNNMPYEEAVAEMVFNHQLFNIEQQRLFMGRASDYKSNLDTTKRAKELIAPGVANALTGTFDAVTINDLKLISAVIDGKIEEAAVAFQSLYKSKYDANKIKRAATDSKYISKLNRYEKAILDVIAPYYDNDSANAVSLITLEEYEKRIHGWGLTNYYADLISKLHTGRPLTKDDYDKMVQLQKNYYYDYSYNEDLQKFIPVQVKNAEVILTPNLVAGLQLQSVADFMNEMGISQINLESAEKNGTIGIARIHDDEGNITSDFRDKLLANVRSYNYSSLRKQQDVPDHVLDAYNKLGVQIAKKIIDNIDNTQQYVVNGKNYDGEQLIDRYFDVYSKNIIESANDLLARIINEVVDVRDVINNREPITINQAALREILMEQAVNLGLSKNIILSLMTNINDEGNVPLYYNTFYKKWQSILTSLFSNNVINQKHPGPHLTQMSTMFLRPPVGNVSQFTQRNYVSKHKSRSSNRYDKSNIEWAQKIHDRKDYRLRAQRVEGGNMVKAEVLLPRTSSMFIQQGRKYSIDELMAIDPKILTMVGYRIPTEDKHSMIVFEVVGFLPDETAAIVLPDDFVTQSGADFDIDSLYLMVYNIERTKDNSLRIVDNTTKDENLLYNRYFKNIFKSSAAKQLIHEMSLPYDELIGTIFQDDVVFERTAKIPIKELKKRFVDAGILMTDAEFSNLSLTEKQKLGETRQGRENEILDIYVSILMHPAHTVERNSPNGHPDIDVAKHMLEEITGRSMEDIDPSTYFGQREFRSRNISGRTLKAFSVSRDSLLSIFQRTGAYVDLEGAPLQMTVKVDPKDQLRTKAHFTRLYPGTTFTTAKEGDETVTYAVIPMEYLGRNGATGFVNIDNKQITSYSAQFTANILDGVKDQLPRNVNEKTLGWMETLINMGFLYTDVIAFYNLPIFETVLDGLEVKDNALKYKKYKKESTVTADVFTQIYRTANKEGLKIYRSTPNGDYDIINTLNNKSVIYPKPSEIDQLLEFYGMSARVMPSLEVMKNDIANRPTDFDATLRNLQYLSVHSTISYITTSIKAVTRPLTVDKLGAGPTFEKTKDIIEKINVRSDNRDVIKVGDKPILNAIFDDYETSAYKPLYTYYNYGNKLAYDILAPLFITELPSYNSVANRLLSVVKDSSVNPKRLEQVVSYMNKQLLNTIPTFSTSDEDIKRIIGYGKVRSTSFRFTQPNAIAAFDKLSLSKKIELMRKRYAKEGIDTSMHIINYFTLETNSAQFDRNKFERVTYIDNDIEDVLIGSFTKLWLSDDVFERSLARDLVKYAYHVNNLSYSYDNIARIIPSAILAYEDNGGSELHSNKGLSVSSKLREAFDLLSGGENGTDNTSIYFGNDNLVEVFILSNYKDDNFVYNANRAIIYDGDNMLNAFTTHPEGFISIPKGTAESFGDAITLAYIKTQDKDGEWHVYKRADLKEGDKYFYYYPVNKLEPFDRSTTSLVPVNNEMLPMNKVDQMLDAHRATVVKTTADIANGINISSTSTNELGKALSNVHYGRNMQSEYDIDPTVGAYGVSYPVNPVTNKPWISPRDRKVTPTEFPSYYKNRSKDNIVSAETVWGKSVEAWYKANTNVDMSLQDKMEVMKALIHIKLLTYPNLYNDIKANGGIDWLDKCSHFVGSNTTTGNWQGSGTDSNFIMALMDAYDLIDTSTVEIQATPIKARFDNTLGNETNTKPGGQLDLFNQEAQFASFTNQDLIDAMTESGDLEIVCSGGAKAQNGMFIGSKLYGDWEVVTDLKGFPKHSAGGVDISVDTDGKIAIAANGATILAADGMFIPNEQPDKPEYEAMSKVLSKRHKHLNWVQRGLSPDNYPSISNPDGTVSTHKLSYVTGENGEAYVYPTIIQQEDGTLKEMDGKSAWEYAKRTNTAMMVPNVELAEYYSKNGLVNHRPTVKSNKTNVNLLKSLNK